MGIFDGLRNRISNAKQADRYQMITEYGNSFYSWNGKVFESDIIRACIRPKTKAIGKLMAKHIRQNDKEVKTNPEPYMRFLLEEPNPYMTGQMMQEKVANQLALNNNAFVLIIRDQAGVPCELYPIPCVTAEAIYINNILHLKFYYRNGKISTFPYSEIIHLRNDFNNNDIFGESPAKTLMPLMNIVTTTDQGIVRAIKNSGAIRWLLKYTSPLRPEDLKRNVKDFTENYLSVESETFGAAGVDAKVEAQRIEPKDYVPNASQTDRTTDRIYSFFNTNKKIVQSNYTEDEWNAYYESEIEPVALQMSGEFTRKLFTRKERGFGNKIYFDASNLQCASLSTKLALQAMVDRGALTPNEWRATFNLSPVEGGDKPIRRLDTAAIDEGGERNGD